MLHLWTSTNHHHFISLHKKYISIKNKNQKWKPGKINLFPAVLKIFLTFLNEPFLQILVLDNMPAGNDLSSRNAIRSWQTNIRELHYNYYSDKKYIYFVNKIAVRSMLYSRLLVPSSLSFRDYTYCTNVRSTYTLITWKNAQTFTNTDNTPARHIIWDCQRASCGNIYMGGFDQHLNRLIAGIICGCCLLCMCVIGFGSADLVYTIKSSEPKCIVVHPQW